MTAHLPWDGRPLETGEAYERLEAFAASHGEAASVLAMHVAVLERFRADLVALVRLNFLPDRDRFDVSLDADLLFGPVALDLGGGYYRMDPQMRRLYLIALDAWAARQGDRRWRSRRVGRFVGDYVAWARATRPRGDDPSFAEYLNLLGWAGLGFADPEEAASRVGRLMLRWMRSETAAAAKIRFGPIAAVLELPLAALMDGLDYARALDAASDEDFETALGQVQSFKDFAVPMGSIELPSPGKALARFQNLADVQRLTPKSLLAGTDGHAEGVQTVAEPSQPPAASTFEEPALESTTLELSALHTAARDGDAEVVRSLLGEAGGDLEATANGRTALHEAAELGHEEVVRLLIEAGARVDARDPRRCTPLHLAAETGWTGTLRQLLVAGADPAARNRKGNTALHMVAYYGHRSGVLLLREYGADVDAVNYESYSPLGVAAYQGRYRMVRLLAELGASIDRGTPTGFSLMHCAARSGSVALADWLADRGAAVDPHTAAGWAPLHQAAWDGHEPMVSWLVDLGAPVDDPPADGWTALHLAAHRGEAGVIDTLAAYGARADVYTEGGWTPLQAAASNGHPEATRALLRFAVAAPDFSTLRFYSAFQCACSKGHAEVVRILLADPRTDPNAQAIREQTPLHLAIDSKSRETVVALLDDPRVDRNADGGKPKSVPLWYAADQDLPEIVEILLADGGVDRDWAQDDGTTLLHRAAEKGQERILELLLASGARVDVAKSDGTTPLRLAVTKKHTAAARLLLGAGAPTADRFQDDSTILHLVARQGLSSLVEPLLDHGAALDDTDACGATPLHVAAERGHLETLETLVRRGARADAEDLFGWPALHLAAQNGQAETIRFLLESGQDPETVSRRPAMTPLQAAAEAGQSDVVALLLKAGADPRAAPGAKGESLLLAVKNGHFKVAKQLLDRGAEPEIADPLSGESLAALGIARWRRADDVGDAEESRRAQLWLRDPATKSALARPPPSGGGRRSSPGPDGEPRRGHVLPGHVPSGHVPSGRVPPEPPDRTGRFAPLQHLEFERPDEPVDLPWSHLKPRQRRRRAAELDQVDTRLAVRAETTQMLTRRLPWYRDHRLIRLRDKAWVPKDLALFYLARPPGRWIRLDGTSPPIHQVNATAPIDLNERTVADYLRFFCFFVRGEQGPFYLLEDAEDPLLPPTIDETTRSILEDLARPVSLRGFDAAKRTFSLEGLVLYSNAMFRGFFEVHPTGMAEMVNDEPIAADLPIRLRLPITGAPKGSP